MGTWFLTGQNTKCRLNESQCLQPLKNNVIFKTLLLNCNNVAQKVASYNIRKLFHLIYCKVLIWQQKGHCSMSHLWLYWGETTTKKTPSHPSYLFLLPLHSYCSPTHRVPEVIPKNNHRWQWYFFANLPVGITANILFLQFLSPFFLYFRSHCARQKRKQICSLAINEVNYRSLLFGEGNCFQLNKEI